MKNKKLIIGVYVVVLVIIALGSFFLGNYVGIHNTGSSNKYEESVSETFYGTITNINDKTIIVKGMEINDINYREEFIMTISDETVLKWHGQDISFEKFHVGDNIAITFSGGLQETMPAKIANVISIKLLDDEME